jgi:hypothetical protein
MKTSQPLANKPFDLDLDALLHPARAFAHPRNVVGDPDLTVNEKRAILASWASDACAVEAAPGLRLPPGAPAPVPVDEILEALRALDHEANAVATASSSWTHRQRRRRVLDAFRGRRGGGGAEPGPNPTH